MKSFLTNYFPGFSGKSVKVPPVLLGLFSLALVRVTQEANLLVTLGPSYVITRFVIGILLAGLAVAHSHVLVHGGA
jgi:hypothetical protein